MNHLGVMMAWCAVQVSLVLLPATVLHLAASRRSAAAGSWITVLGLGLSVLLSVCSFLPGPRGWNADGIPSRFPVHPGAWGRSPQGKPPESAGLPRPPSGGFAGQWPARPQAPGGGGGVRLALTLTRLGDIFKRLDRGAAAPVETLRRWGRVVAAAGITGGTIGLLRLFLSLGAVHLCRRRGAVVNDPGLIALLDATRAALGCRRAVEVRALPGLTTPATAGWRRPVLLLPDDWRTWSDAERRAVLAHEVAHITRRDYAAGLVAQLALAVHFYHPLVHWMVRRLQLQQELAADAIGCELAGGRYLYLRALSRLALEQDGRSSCGPARAFLPARGTLIRRIAMLQNPHAANERPWPAWRRLMAGLGLVVVALFVAALRGPARAGQEEAPVPPRAAPRQVFDDLAFPIQKGGAPAPPPAAPRRVGLSAVDGTATSAPAPFDVRYVLGNSPGLVAFRPAATVRRPELAFLAQQFSTFFLPQLAKQCEVDLSQPGFLKLGLEDIEWITASLSFGPEKVIAEGKRRGRLMLGNPIIRTTGPFDWPRLLRQLRFELTEVRESGQLYYRLTGPSQFLLGPKPGGVYLPDDRTLVLADEDHIRRLLRREQPVAPPYLAGPDWERVSRGLLAIALRNEAGALAKAFNLGRPEDALFLSLFPGDARWVLGVDNTDLLVTHATATCQADVSPTLARTVESLAKLARDSLALADPAPGTPDQEFPDNIRVMLKNLLAHLRIEQSDHGVSLHAEGFGSVADFAAILQSL